MNTEQAKQYCQSKPEALADYPFGPDVVVYKIRNKIFALIPEHVNANSVLTAEKNKNRIPKRIRSSISLKCDPDRAQALRDLYPAITGGYHLNKKHWNTLLLDGSVPQSEIESQIDHSYCLVVSGLRKNERDALRLRYGDAVLLNTSTKKHTG